MKFIKYIPNFKIGWGKVYLQKRYSRFSYKGQNYGKYHPGVHTLRTLGFRFFSFYKEWLLIEENIFNEKHE